MGGLQHWDIALDSQEISHLGNDGRIPTFNSRYRDILPLPNTRLRYPQDGYQHPWQRIETAYKSIDP